MNSKTIDSQVRALPAACGDLFSFAAYLRESSEFEQTDEIYEGILNLIASMERKARDSSIAEEDIQRAKHAIVAFLDETLRWESRLERHYFSSSIAGDEFFDRLDAMLDRARQAELPYGVLEVYYICLTLGFGGRHIGETGTLQRYIRRLQEVLNAETSGQLSPNGERPVEEARKQRSAIPLWILLSCIAGGVLIVSVVLIVLKIQIYDWAASVINRIRSFLQ